MGSCEISRLCSGSLEIPLRVLQTLQQSDINTGTDDEGGGELALAAISSQHKKTMQSVFESDIILCGFYIIILLYIIVFDCTNIL